MKTTHKGVSFVAYILQPVNPSVPDCQSTLLQMLILDIRQGRLHINNDKDSNQYWVPTKANVVRNCLTGVKVGNLLSHSS